jgi:hypothetical protein
MHAIGDCIILCFWYSLIPKTKKAREADMYLSPGEERSSLHDENPVRRAAMLVLDELGENAAAYALDRATVLQRQGDEMGALAWRRVAPVIEEMQRNGTAAA